MPTCSPDLSDRHRVCVCPHDTPTEATCEATEQWARKWWPVCDEHAAEFPSTRPLTLQDPLV